MIRNSEGTEYVGATSWLKRRLQDHKKGDKASLRCTQNCESFELVWAVEEPTRYLALELEALVHSYGVNGRARIRSKAYRKEEAILLAAKRAQLGLTGGVCPAAARGHHVKAEESELATTCLDHGESSGPTIPASGRMFANSELSACGTCGNETGQCICWLEITKDNNHVD